MSEYNPNRYLPTIDAILSVANLEEITVKKIRNALQELFGIDLKPHKQYYDLVDKRKDEEKSEKERLKEIERQDALLAARLSKSAVAGPIMRARAVNSKKKAVKPSNGEKKNSPFNREMLLSHELYEVLGTAKLSRPQVVKQLWAYIKDNNLQNPDDKRQIVCDSKLQAVFKKKLVGAFEMNKILSSHIFKPEEVDESSNLVKSESTDNPTATPEISESESEAE